MIEQASPAGPDRPESDREEARPRFNGPFWLAAILSVAGLAFLSFGSVTIVPWIADERESMTVRSIWLALSRNLPDLGPDLLVRAGFWVIVALVVALAIALMFLASTIDDDARTSGI